MQRSLPETSPPPVVVDRPGLFHGLEAGGRFRRDTRLGGILHRGKVSFREVSPNDSLHVLIDGNRLSAHVDQVCPLDCDAEGAARYPWARVVAHNVSDVLTGVVRRVQGRHGHHHCHLECEMVWVDDGESAAGEEASPPGYLGLTPCDAADELSA